MAVVVAVLVVVHLGRWSRDLQGTSADDKRVEVSCLVRYCPDEIHASVLRDYPQDKKRAYKRGFNEGLKLKSPGRG